MTVEKVARNMSCSSQEAQCLGGRIGFERGNSSENRRSTMYGKEITSRLKDLKVDTVPRQRIRDPALFYCRVFNPLKDMKRLLDSFLRKGSHQNRLSLIRGRLCC